MRASQTADGRDIDLATLPRAVGRNAIKLTLAAGIIGALTYGVLLLVPSDYRSEAQIRIGSTALGDGGRASGASPEQAALLVDREAIASRVQELRSSDLATKLAAELRLAERPEFNSAVPTPGLWGQVLRLTGLQGPRAGESEEERVLSAYNRALHVHNVKDTRVITVAFTTRDGELSARAANRLIEHYQTWLRQQGVAETTDTSALLVPEIEKRTRELGKAEAEADLFRSSANLFRGAGGPSTGLAEQQLSDLSAELTRARSQRGEADARARAARDLVARNSPEAIPDVQKSPVMQGLVAQRVKAERELAEAAAQLLPAHPRMKQLNATLADVRRQMQREAAIVVEGLEREAKALALREDLAARSVEDAKGRLGAKSGERVRLSQLEDDVKAKRRELEVLRDRFEAARSRSTTKAGPVEVQVIATALAAGRPSAPNRPQIAALAGAAAFVLGLVGVLFRELLSGGGRAQPAAPVRGDVARASPSLASPSRADMATPRREAAMSPTSPVVTGEAKRNAGDAAHPPRSAQWVVDRLLGNSAGQSGYRTLVVGDSARIDAQETAFDVATRLASAGRQVVLVEWGNGVGRMARRLGLEAGPGFTELLAGSATFDDVIHTLPGSEVHVIPAGPSEMKPDALDPDRLNLLLDALDEAYGDVVVTGNYAEVLEFFLAIEGRFDAGVVVARPGSGVSDGGSQFLGLEVTEIDVIRFEPAVAEQLMSGGRRQVRSAENAVMRP